MIFDQFSKIRPLLILIFTRSPLLYFLVCPQKSMLHEIFRFQFHSSIMYYVFPALVQSRSAGAKQQPSLSASLSRISLISVHTPFCLSFSQLQCLKSRVEMDPDRTDIHTGLDRFLHGEKSTPGPRFARIEDKV